jgi:hypothetical protein
MGKAAHTIGKYHFYYVLIFLGTQIDFRKGVKRCAEKFLDIVVLFLHVVGHQRKNTWHY